MHHFPRNTKTHLGAWLPLLTLWSSPPRAALPARHRAAVINIIILTTEQIGARRTLVHFAIHTMEDAPPEN